MVTATLTSASGLLSLLEESSSTLQIYALEHLNTLIDTYWAEMGDSLALIEALYEDVHFPRRDLAALLASKVYYHLGAYDESLNLALGARTTDWDFQQRDSYSETILEKALDRYIKERQASLTSDARLTKLVEQVWDHCLQDKAYQQALGMALEARRLDILERILLAAKEQGEQERTDLLQYCRQVTLSLLEEGAFVHQVLRLLVQQYQSLQPVDYLAMAECFVLLQEASSLVQLLKQLEKENALMAYQVAFYIQETATLETIARVQQGLSQSHHTVATSNNNNADAMETDALLQTYEVVAAPPSPLQRILSGHMTRSLFAHFLSEHNHADILILKNTRQLLDPRQSLQHTALSLSYALMLCGTGRDEISAAESTLTPDWIQKSSNWAKWTAVAAQGVVHRGRVTTLKECEQVLGAYWPRAGVTQSPFVEGGAYYAIGLSGLTFQDVIENTNSNTSSDSSNAAPSNSNNNVSQFLIQALQQSQHEAIQHGACLGLGLVGMSSQNVDLYEALKNVLYSDQAVAGEAAALAMGMIHLASGNATVHEEMLQYAMETRHEKMTRALGVGMALLQLGRGALAEAGIETLLASKEALLRYAAMWMTALAYVGSGDRVAVKRLLHVAVSETNDEVRRVAVMALGFVLCQTPHQVPRVVALLAESHHTHVRYGAAMALGVACAGTGWSEAITLLQQMTKDSVDLVRQAAFVSLAMVQIQSNQASSTRQQLEKVIQDKLESPATRFGAILSQGLLDAGGRASVHASAVVGMTLFLQHWHWYPLSHCLCLALTPTALLGVNGSLQMPKEWQVTCLSRPSVFAYVPATKAPTLSLPERLATAVLSTTLKAKARKEKKNGTDVVMENSNNANSSNNNANDVSMDVDEKEEKPSEEARSFPILNGERLLAAQRSLLSFDASHRYVPILSHSKQVTSNVLVLKDTQPDLPEILVPLEKETKTVPSTDAPQEPSPPESFEYVESTTTAAV